MAIELATTAPARVGRRYAGSFSQPTPYAARDFATLGNAVTPARLTDLLGSRNAGYLAAWVDFANEMRRNSPHLQSQLAIRELSTVETVFDVVPGDDSPAAEDAAAACIELEQEWDRQGLEDWVAEFVASKYYGVGAHEVLWQRIDGLLVPYALARIDERRLSYACEYNDPEPWRLRLWDQDVIGQPYYGTPLADFGADKVLLHEPRVLGGPRTAEGIFSSVVWYTVFAVWSWRDLMALCEMLGRPPVIATYAAGGARQGRENEFTGSRNALDEDVDAAREAVFGLSGSLRAVLPDTVRVEMLKYAAPASPTQLLAEERANALISKAVNGVANLSDLQPGARAAVEAQERTTYTFWRADCRTVARKKTSLYERFVRANPQRFGADCPVPRAVPKLDPVRDTKAIAEGLGLAQGLGVRVPRAWAYEALGIPEPQADANGVEEPVLEAPTPPPAEPPPADDPSRDEPPPAAAPAAPATAD